MEEVRRAYSEMAEQYIELITRTTGAHSDDFVFIDRHLSTSDGIVLDVGCGPGHLTAHLRTLGVEAIGIDPVPEFIEHARATHPDGTYELGSMHRLAVADHSVAGVLAWYSTIHMTTDELEDALVELRRVVADGGRLVIGFFDGEQISAFDHKVTTAFYRPADDFSARLARAGFTEIDRLQRPGENKVGRRPQAAIAATAT